MKKLNEVFLTIADRVSYAMGTPFNIIFWIVAVLIWFLFGPTIAHSNFLPEWFTSNAFNFPLNTVTTLAELYIGFLVGAASNRTERHNEEMMKKQDEMLAKIAKVQEDEMKELHERSFEILNNVQALEKTILRVLEDQIK